MKVGFTFSLTFVPSFILLCYIFLSQVIISWSFMYSFVLVWSYNVTNLSISQWLAFIVNLNIFSVREVFIFVIFIAIVNLMEDGLDFKFENIQGFYICLSAFTPIRWDLTSFIRWLETVKPVKNYSQKICKLGKQHFVQLWKHFIIWFDKQFSTSHCWVFVLYSDLTGWIGLGNDIARIVW